MFRVGIIGVGNMGSNHLKVFLAGKIKAQNAVASTKATLLIQKAAEIWRWKNG